MDTRDMVTSALLSLFFVSGCTDTATTIDPPFLEEQLKLNELIGKAKSHCLQRRGASSEQPIYEFTTDGCSAFPDRDWRSCCVIHDISYWCGGTENERTVADEDLKTCITNKGHPNIAAITYFGVRLGGPPWLPFPWRWGYGWDWPRRYDSEK